MIPRSDPKQRNNLERWKDEKRRMEKEKNEKRGKEEKNGDTKSDSECRCKMNPV